MRHATIWLALLAAALSAGSAQAQQRGPQAPGRSTVKLLQPDQVKYSRAQVAGATLIEAEWIEPDGTRRALNFHLPAITDPQRALVPPSTGRKHEAGFAAAQIVASQTPPGVTLRVLPRGTGISVEAGGPSGADLQTPINRVMEAYRSASDRVIGQAGFVLVSANVIEPDYRRLLAEQSALLRATAEDIAHATQRLGQRERVALLLGFVQSIPYMTLRARDAAALRTPAGVLAEDRGDCDEKSMTLATLLAVTDPDLSTALLTGHEHAFLAVSLPPAPGDIAAKIGGRSYVMLEPVGPGWFPVGQLSGMSLAILRSPKAHAVVLNGG